MGGHPAVRVATANEVAELLRVSPATVYRMAQAGELPTLSRVGPLLRFDLDAVEAWLRCDSVEAWRGDRQS